LWLQHKRDQPSVNRSRSTSGVWSADNSTAPHASSVYSVTTDGTDARLHGIFPSGDLQG